MIEMATIFLRLLEKSSLSSKTYFSCGNLCNDFQNVFSFISYKVYHNEMQKSQKSYIFKRL